MGERNRTWRERRAPGITVARGGGWSRVCRHDAVDWGRRTAEADGWGQRSVGCGRTGDNGLGRVKSGPLRKRILYFLK
jgi:hypothetical protein